MSGTSRLRLGAMVLTVTLAVAGCNGGDSAMPTDPGAVEGSVTFWTYPIGDSGKDSYWDPVVEQFKQKYPKVDVDVVVQPFTNREETLVTAIAGKQGPDVVYFNPDFIPKFAVEGVLEPVEDVIADDRDDFTPAALDAMSWDGKLYGVPLLMQALIGVCNKQVLAASGVEKCPETWADIEQMAPKVKAAGYVPTDYVAAQTLTLNHSFYPYLWQAGGEVLTADGKKAAFNSPEGLRALEFVKKLVDNGWTSQQSLTTAETLEQSALGQGKQAYSPNNTTASLAKLFKPEELVVSQPLTDKVQVAAGSVGGLSVLAGSDAKAASKAWIDFLTSPEHMRSFDQKNGYYAPRKSVTGLYADNPGMAEGEKHLDVIRSGVIHPKAREIMNLIKPHLQAVLLGKTAPGDALAAAEKDVNALLERR
ncbi:extracellular solute-binding protein [Micromonospora sp. NPDC047465]|uniref:ABC transporter substrate-binding protein n=1 Tax=Micromonospora sp. NPDC047465 TaxID=3154813 RepID=UPI0033DA887F